MDTNSVYILYKSLNLLLKALGYKLVGDKIFSLMRTPPPPYRLGNDPRVRLAGAGVAGMLVGKPQIILKPLSEIRKGLLYLAKENTNVNNSVNATIIADLVQHYDVEQVLIVLHGCWLNPSIQRMKGYILASLVAILVTNLKKIIMLLKNVVKFYFTEPYDVNPNNVRSLHKDIIVSGAKDILQNPPLDDSRISFIRNAANFRVLMALAARFLAADD